MKRRIIPVAFLACLSTATLAQDFGLSFSYFLPKNGYFSTPISPFSIRGVGVDLTSFLAVETGASLYRMSGLNVKDLPFESKSPLVGPNFTIFIPLELVFMLKGSAVEFDIKGGGFFFYGFDQRINYGNMDRAIRTYEGWTVANSSFEFDNKPGFGYHGGVEFTVYATSQFGISLEANYLVGHSKFPLTGTYTGGNNSIETRNVEFGDAKIDLTGLEIALGIIFTPGGQQPTPRRRR
jgi:hypothetical protein